MSRYCIYFLIKRKKVVYIGVSRNLKARLKNHKYEKPHDSVRVIGGLTRTKAFHYETRWIKRFEPKYNKAWMKATKKGRNKVNQIEKVILVGFYTKRHIIDSLGGMDRIREIAKVYVESRAEADEVGRMAMHG